MAGPRLESAGEEKAAAAKAAIFGQRKGERTRNQSKASAESKRWRTSSSSSTRRWPRNHHQRDRIIPRRAAPAPHTPSAAPLQEPTASLPTPNRRSPKSKTETRKNKTEIFFSKRLLLLPHISNLSAPLVPVSPCLFPPAHLDPLLGSGKKMFRTKQAK